MTKDLAALAIPSDAQIRAEYKKLLPALRRTLKAEGYAAGEIGLLAFATEIEQLGSKNWMGLRGAPVGWAHHYTRQNVAFKQLLSDILRAAARFRAELGSAQ